jgi:Mrp family chromosome partitioning ATPase
MTTPAYFADGTLQMGMQIRGGPWQTFPLASRDVSPALVFASEKQAARAPGYQALADKIIEDRAWSAARQIFVTSPDRGDGRTSTAFNLAWALSTRVKPVLLAELNLGEPRMRAMLGKPRIRYGIDCVLRGIASGKESVFSLVTEDLHVAAVRDAMNRSEIKRFQPSVDSFIDWALGEYKWVVFDCPPVLSRSWKGWFAEHADPVLLLARSEKTPAIDVRRASRRLGSSLKGVVLNSAGATAALSTTTPKL